LTLGQAFSSNLWKDLRIAVYQEHPAACRRKPASDGQTQTLVQDLQDPHAGRVILVHALEKLGGVDTLINNAAWSLHRPFLETSLEDFDKIVAVNQRAPFFLIQELFRYISKSPVEVRDPVVVNVASGRGRIRRQP